MSSRFIPCVYCARHIKQGDSSTCPFCGIEVPRVNAPATRTVAGHLSRSALLAISALGAAVAGTDCSSTPIVPYGVPPNLGDAAYQGTDGSSSTPEDAAKDAAPEEMGSLLPMYGLPVFPDAGHD